MPRCVPIKFDEFRFPMRGLNFGREGKLDLSQWDEANRLPVNALPIGLYSLLGGDSVEASNFYRGDYGINTGNTEDMIDESELSNYYIRGFSCSGTGDGILSLYASVSGAETLIYRVHLDDGLKFTTKVFPNHFKVDEDGGVRVEIENLSAGSEQFDAVIHGISYTGDNV